MVGIRHTGNMFGKLRASTAVTTSTWMWETIRLWREAEVNEVLLDLDTTIRQPSCWVRTHTITAPGSSEPMAIEHVFGQILDSSGTSGSIFQISQIADTYEPNAIPKVALNDAGKFVVDWSYIPPYTISNSDLPLQSNGTDHMIRGIYARQYGSNNAATTDEFLVVKSPVREYPNRDFYLSIPDHPIGIDSAGNFVVGYIQSFETTFRVRIAAFVAGQTTSLGYVQIATDFSPLLTRDQPTMDENGDFEVAGMTPRGRLAMTWPTLHGCGT